MAKIMRQTIAVMTSSRAEANILRIELKLLRNRLVMIPQSALLNITMNTSGSKSTSEIVWIGFSTKEFDSLLETNKSTIKLHTIESTYMNTFWTIKWTPAPVSLTRNSV